MSDRAFESDAAYFDLVARLAKDPTDQIELRKVAEVYRSLAKRGLPGRSPLFMKSRADLWRDRAGEGRTPSGQFTHWSCRGQTNRPAETNEKNASVEPPEPRLW